MADNLGTGSAGQTDLNDWGSTPGNGGLSKSGGSNAAAVLTDAAHQYVDKISDVAVQAREYVSDKATMAGEKIKEFATDDLGALAKKAKDFARQNPGQAILISAAAGVLLGLVVRGRR